MIDIILCLFLRKWDAAAATTQSPSVYGINLPILTGGDSLRKAKPRQKKRFFSIFSRGAVQVALNRQSLPFWVQAGAGQPVGRVYSLKSLKLP